MGFTSCKHTKGLHMPIDSDVKKWNDCELTNKICGYIGEDYNCPNYVPCDACPLTNKKCDMYDEHEKLRAENQSLKFMLKDIAEKGMTLDVLTYLEKLPDDAKIDAGDIHKKLGYKISDIQKIIDLLMEMKDENKRK